MTDLALRAHNHNYNFDPIVRSLLDDDAYKFVMQQAIFKAEDLGFGDLANVEIEFSVKNRTTKVQLADIIPIEQLIEQLDHARTVKLSGKELSALRGMTFYGKKFFFDPEYIEYLESYQLPDYELIVFNGQFQLNTKGKWIDRMLWEIHFLTILSELRTRQMLKTLNKFELDILYSNAKTKLWNKLQLIKNIPGVADFGTRRRHSFGWQEWAIQAAASALGKNFIGTSNVLFATENSLQAIGTNAHELPMTLAALANDANELHYSQYKVLKLWQKAYDGNLLVGLPDTFGTKQFLDNAPEWVLNWKGFRVDSMDPKIAGEMFIDFYKKHGIDPRDRLVIFSDGLDAQDIVDLYKQYDGRIKIGFGWGTNFSNDFKDCHPYNLNVFDPISLVCKIIRVNGRSAVKLSDNPTKAIGDQEQVQHYMNVFGTEGFIAQEVKV